MALVVFGALGVGLLGGAISERIALARFEQRAMSDASLRQALLSSEIARFRLLPRVLSDDRGVVAAIDSPTPSVRQALNLKLEQLAHEIAAPVIYVIGADAITLGASNWRHPESFVGKSYLFRPYFRDALKSGTGEQFALGNTSRKPGLYLANRSVNNGVVVVKLEFDTIETQWSRAEGVTFVTDRNGVILVSSRPEWRFAATRSLSKSVRLEEEQTSGVRTIGGPPFVTSGMNRILLENGRAYLLATTKPDASGWRVNLALPLKPTVDSAVRSAQFISGLAALIVFGAVALLVERNRQRRVRTQQLEAAVAERTAALRDEMAERTAAEQRAAQLREGLRQANRLATLGQITASVAHETAQPVAAIRNYAANSAIMLERGDGDGVRQNLAAISRLAERIGSVTSHLRGFARKGAGIVGEVPLDEVIEGARLILKEQLAPIDVQIRGRRRKVCVKGERVRLEQVLVNLLQNAAEALDAVAEPRITLEVLADGDCVRLRVSDNGPGIDATIADTLFTPFSTSRTTGLGLGLVIAKDIIEELGGTLSLVESDGGACFEVRMVRVP
ncbi:sensor histidine kinase [Novosphingobium taihuense]|uniref:histidine kinase n=1 Tax=Novosphingobium taihuense TaxID=260085 RepID=A0A7W7A9E2_9SPHN|nr:ATP-binding protein [Novosphingobium taihuense]MBB4612863.1 two-component system C4-dicarboxylate transport sensor histidine kinase DctB [Novosphingobium taihuense]